MVPDVLGETASEKMLSHIFNVMRENEAFLHNNAEEAYDAVVSLMNDAIEQAGLSAKLVKNSEHPSELAMTFFIHHVLMPFSYGVYIDLLAGNTPTCFMQLRLMLETMGECYLADEKYEGVSFFHDRLESLKQEKLRPWKIVSRAGKILECEEQFRSLWGKLSEDWLHPKGIADIVMCHLAETSVMPAWSLIIPMNYVPEDLVGINHLGKRVSQFRDVLAITMRQYWHKDDPK